MNTEKTPRATGQDAHTPTPYSIRLATTPHGDAQAVIEVSDGTHRSKIAVLHDGWLCPEHGGTVEANARFIVQACNAYAANVARIAELEGALTSSLFALESVLMLASSRLSPQAVQELTRYAGQARKTLTP